MTTYCPADSRRRALTLFRGRRPLSPILPALILSLVVGGCALVGSGGGDEPERPPVTLRVENGNYLDVAIYIVTSAGETRRLGSVTGQQETTFTLERRYTDIANDIRFGVDPLGSRERFLSQPVLFTPGDTIVMEVGPRLALTVVYVR